MAMYETKLLYSRSVPGLREMVRDMPLTPRSHLMVQFWVCCCQQTSGLQFMSSHAWSAQTGEADLSIRLWGHTIARRKLGAWVADGSRNGSGNARSAVHTNLLGLQQQGGR